MCARGEPSCKVRRGDRTCDANNPVRRRRAADPASRRAAELPKMGAGGRRRPPHPSPDPHPPLGSSVGGTPPTGHTADSHPVVPISRSPLPRGRGEGEPRAHRGAGIGGRRVAVAPELAVCRRRPGVRPGARAPICSPKGAARWSAVTVACPSHTPRWVPRRGGGVDPVGVRSTPTLAPVARPRDLGTRASRRRF